jgi:hypothetical protein
MRVSAKALPREEAMLMISANNGYGLALVPPRGLCCRDSCAFGSSTRTMRTYYFDDVQNL